MLKNILIVMAVLVADVAFAIDPPTPGTPAGAPPPPVGLPIDAWVLPVLLLGIAFGFSKLIVKKKAI